MFSTIYTFEIRRWLKSWELYLYLVLFFAMTFFAMASSVGVFDAVKNTSSSLLVMNSPVMLSTIINSFNMFVLFLFPSIIGMSIYRDYKYDMHQLLYSYPFSKWQYLLGKFLAGISIVLLINVVMLLGSFLATLLPWANAELLGPNHFWTYAQVLLITVLPNILFMGALILSIVTLTRSVYVGFIAIIIIMVIQGLLDNLSNDLDYREIAALLEPSGMLAMDYYTNHWSVQQVNTSNLPLEKWFVLNRLIWLGVSCLFIIGLGRLFSFTQGGISFSLFGKKQGQVMTKNNFGGIFTIDLPKVDYVFSCKANWQNTWAFTILDFKFLAKNRVFLILIGVGVLFMVIMSTFAMTMYGTSTYYITRQILTVPGSVFSLFIAVITFLGAGLLVNRARLTSMYLLSDSTPCPSWVMFLSKSFALIAMQICLLFVILITGIGIQMAHGYYHFELGLYFQKLFAIELPAYILWAILALFIQNLFKNYIIGFFVILLFYLGWSVIGKIGIEQPIFYLNELPRLNYSDMNGFGSSLPRYYTFLLYWFLLAGSLWILGLLFYKRGTGVSATKRFTQAKKRSSLASSCMLVVLLLGFFSLGGYLYYENTVLNTYRSSKDSELHRVEYEKKYKKYEKMLLPRIVSADLKVDLFPESNDLKVKAQYVLVNKHNQSIDSLLVYYNEDLQHLISMPTGTLVEDDTKYGIAFYKLDPALAPGDSLVFNFELSNKPNTLIRKSGLVLGNGTFINNGIFPGFGYQDNGEISQNSIRKKYELPEKERMALQSDSLARTNTYISNAADWIDFKAVVSTSGDQIAIAPGYLNKQWQKDGRNYFEYEMDQPMLNFYAFNSGVYQVAKDNYKDIAIEVYYHKDHHYNVDRMIESIKASLDYYTTEFGPYQHSQVRIIEFPLSNGTFAQSFANTIPFSEAIGFVAKVDPEDQNAVDYPYSVTAHEVAHQWWAHQVIGANVQGATMLSESLSEYSALKVLEKQYGQGQMQRFLKDALDNYLRGRRYESHKELALMYNENQQYIHYNKGSLVFYALSDYIGEQKLNQTLSEYIKEVGFQDAPYTISADLVDKIKQVTPDSLSYLVHDMFETITLYDNYIDKVEVEPLDNGKYQVTIKAITSKFRSDDKGEKLFADSDEKTLEVDPKGDEKKIQSLPLNDYIEVGVFTKDKDQKDSVEKVLYLQKHKITDIENEFILIVDEKPTHVGIDPYNKLIDSRSFDNRKDI